MANTNAAAAGGAIAALILTMIIYGKTDLTFVLNGALAGLVSITAEPLFPGLGTASLIGAVGGVIVVFAVPLLDRLRIDDVVGAIPVHLFAGIWGTIAVVFTNPDATIGGQLGGIVIVGLFTFAVTAAIWFGLKFTMGLRPRPMTRHSGSTRPRSASRPIPNSRPGRASSPPSPPGSSGQKRGRTKGREDQNRPFFHYRDFPLFR